MPSTHLPDRGLVLVAGEDARTFLQNIVTCDIDGLAPGEARLGALLTPQGKILFDFLVTWAPEGAEAFPNLRGYFLDFVCFGRKLVIELDGWRHAEAGQAQHDNGRDAVLRR